MLHGDNPLKMSDLNFNSFAWKLSPCTLSRLHLGSCCPQYMETLLIQLHGLVAHFRI